MPETANTRPELRKFKKKTLAITFLLTSPFKV